MNTTGPSFDARDLRHAFGSFGTGVTVVTARLAGGRMAGVTVNSFSSVSLEPPIVAWSLARTSPSLEVFDGAGYFVINVLALDQVALARRFASPISDKFFGVAWEEGLCGQPVLADCAASLQCRVVGRHAIGDHYMYLGGVEHYAHAPRPPLLFQRGSYLQGVSLDETLQPATSSIET